jgi:hypothetical protein
MLLIYSDWQRLPATRALGTRVPVRELAVREPVVQTRDAMAAELQRSPANVLDVCCPEMAAAARAIGVQASLGFQKNPDEDKRDAAPDLPGLPVLASPR